MMPPPNDADVFPENVQITRAVDGTLIPSQGLVDLLVQARSSYEWPENTGAAQSQNAILQLENDVHGLMRSLSPEDAQNICIRVSEWAGNNQPNHNNVVHATPDVAVNMQRGIALLMSHRTANAGMRLFADDIPGISLVIASKIFRFVIPQVGAAVDRHASYFFNSLHLIDGQAVGRATLFHRQWQNGPNGPSRLSFQPNHMDANHGHYHGVYLPLLSDIAYFLTIHAHRYTCAVTGLPQAWRPADVEMAGYYWWAQNGLP